MPGGLFHHMALNLEECITELMKDGQPTFPGYSNGTAWCNATWDTFLCWPAIPANTSYTLPCPPLRGLIAEKHVEKFCHESARWAGRNEFDFSLDHGYTNYQPCMRFDYPIFESPVPSMKIMDEWYGIFPGRVDKHCHHTARWAGKDENDFDRTSGWTNYSVCLAPTVKDFMDDLGAAIQRAQQIAADARKLEFVGLTLSMMSLIVAIAIFSMFRRLRVFRNQIHQQLMLAILLTVVIRLILYIDLSFSKELSLWVHGSEIGYTINSTKVVCETFYILLEYLKTVAFAFMFIEGFYLHNTVVVQVFQASEPILKNYLIVAWGIPAIHITIWIAAIMGIRGQFSFETCLGEYYMQPEFWIMDGVRLLELVVNFVFLLNIVRVLWLKVKETHNATEMDNLKKSVRAALMLIPLLGIPNIMQTIPFTPNRNNIIFFAVFTYCASFFYMFQGIMVAVLYCFTNREVIDVIKSRWGRFKLRHQSMDRMRHGSVRMHSENTQLQINSHYEQSNMYRDPRIVETPYATTGFNSYNNGTVMHTIENDQLSNKHELCPLVSSVNRPGDYNPINKLVKTFCKLLE